VCEKPACEYNPEEAAAAAAAAAPAQGSCCQCDEKGLTAALEMADTHAPAANRPSFMEVMHTTKFHKSMGKQMCCPCGQQ